VILSDNKISMTEHCAASLRQLSFLLLFTAVASPSLEQLLFKKMSRF